MREHVVRASRRRDERLARVRKLTRWITGGAAAASLGMGTAFAHELPGHSASTPTSSRSMSTGAAQAGTNASGSGAAGTSAGSGSRRGHHHRHRLAPPAQRPVSTPAAPVVSSGGS